VASRPPSARLFVALDLPAEARSALVEWREKALGDREALRPVAPDGLHVTLVFLGHLPEAEITPIGKLVQAALPAIEAPLLTPVGVKAVPPRRPRLFALDLDDQGGRAGLIQAAVSEALAGGGLYEPEQRPFWPHVTLARVKKGGAGGDVPAAPAQLEPWRAEAITLYRSRLARSGARYEALARFGL
jgi:RNA 2',3'-cyclic 3'-phosphodiesterase